MANNNIMASVTYRCKTETGYPFMLTADLVDNFGFDYGNHHGIGIYEESGNHYFLDARYDKRFGTVKGFYKHILEVLKDNYAIAEAELVEEDKG